MPQETSNVFPMRTANGLPHSEEAERAVLACLLLKPDLIDQAQDLLYPFMFFLERHQLIFRAYLSIDQHEGEIDLTTLQAELDRNHDFETVGGAAYLAGLDLDLPDIAGFERYVEIVKERWSRRELILKLQAVTADALDSTVKTPELIAGIQDSLLNLDRASSAGGQYRHVMDVLLDIDFWTPKESGLLGLPCGLVDLDRLTLGAQAGQLIIIAGRPSMGKTSLAAKMALGQALHGVKVGFVSLEDTATRVGTKWVSQLTSIPYQQLALGQISQRQGEQVMDAVRKISAAPLYLDETGGQTVEQIASAARRLAVQHGLEILYVDYLHLASTTKKHSSHHLMIGAISLTLKELAKSLDIPVMLLSQLSREVEKRPLKNRTPMLSDLRESGKIEEHADQVWFCYRPEVYEPTNEEVAGLGHIVVAKIKDGQTGCVETYFHGPTMSFHNLERHHPEWG